MIPAADPGNEQITLEVLVENFWYGQGWQRPGAGQPLATADPLDQNFWPESVVQVRPADAWPRLITVSDQR